MENHIEIIEYERLTDQAEAHAAALLISKRAMIAHKARELECSEKLAEYILDLEQRLRSLEGAE